jgi:DNA (cytosine-5)-methyltransferase 1
VNELALFAGAGGGILGGTLLGWRTVCAVEFDPYARDVLVARQNDGCLPPFPIWDDVRTFDGRPWRGVVDVVSGGFPCQDISAAGKGAGITGSRSGLWKHMARIIGEVLPPYVYVENSPMLVGRGLATIIADLAQMGYDARWGIVGACDAGAPHQRERIWIKGSNISDTKHLGRGRGRQNEPERECEEVGRSEQLGRYGGNRDVADTESPRTRHDCQNHGSRCGEIHASDNAGCACGRNDRQEDRQTLANAAGAQDDGIRRDCECGRNTMGRQEQAAQQDHGAPDHDRACGCREIRHAEESGLERTESAGNPRAGGCPAEHGPGRRKAGWWESEPDVGRVAHGVAARVDRLRCIGNGQVPAVVRLAWETLMGTSMHNAALEPARKEV